MKPKISFITYIFGKNNECVREILDKSPDCEYLLITDDPDIKSTTWTVIYDNIDDSYSPFDKVLKVRYFPEKYCKGEYIIRLDSSIQILKHPKPWIDDFINNNYIISHLPHPTTTSLYEELIRWARIRGYNIDAANIQLKFLIDQNYNLNLKHLIQLNLSMYKVCPEILAFNKIIYNNLQYLKLKHPDAPRLDQTIYSAIYSRYLKDTPCLLLSSAFLYFSQYFEIYIHNTTTPIPRLDVKQTLDLDNNNKLKSPDKKWFINEEHITKHYI